MRYFIISSYDVNVSGGLSTYVNELMNEIDKNGYEVILITPFNNKDILFLVSIFLSKVIYVINNFLGLKIYYLLLLLKIKKLIFENKINEGDILHFQDVLSIRSLKNKKIKGLLTVHGDLTNMNISDNLIKKGTKLEKYCLGLELEGYKIANKIITVDTRLKDHLLKFLIDNNKINILLNFTNIDKFNKIEPEFKKTLRKKYNFPLNKKIIFCPRRLVEKNGVIYTIDIINKLSKDYLLIIIGSGPAKNSIINKIKEYNIDDKVIILGEITNNKIVEYYQLSDIVIIPSISSSGVIEATSISTLESMSCGIPVIASSIGGLKEIISDKIDGYLIEEKNINMFVFQINYYFNLKDSDKILLSNNARRKIENNFSSSSYFKKLKNLLLIK